MIKTSKWLVLILVVLALILTWTGCSAPTTPAVIEIEIMFPDGNLQNAISEACGNLEQITLEDLEAITFLNCDNKEIVNLNGLEYLKNLEILILSNNTQLISIAPLQGLKKLKELYIDCDVSLDTTNLKLPDSLTTLVMSETYFTDINFITDLPNLIRIDMDCCYVDNLQPLTANKNIADGVSIDLTGTPIHGFINSDLETAFETDVQTLQNRGVYIIR